MDRNNSSLEKKIWGPFAAGVVTGIALAAIEVAYIIPQKTFWSGREVAGLLAAELLPVIVGALPLTYHAIRMTCKDIKENGVLPRLY